MLFHIGEYTVERGRRLFLSNACIGHHQKNDITYRRSANLTLPFHNLQFDSSRSKNMPDMQAGKGPYCAQFPPSIIKFLLKKITSNLP